jgi:signal recognition particle receptor subunit beta
VAFINHKKREVQVKIVYTGPGRGGKTTNLRYLYEKLNSHINTEMVTIKTYGDRTLFFDFFPIDLGTIKGYEVKVQLYTVPGQARYNVTNKLVLKGVDGIVFVADSMAIRREKNVLSLRKLRDNLAAYDRSIQRVPLVMQYNKRDLAEQGIPILSVDEMEKMLNADIRAHAYESSALYGINVIQTVKKIIGLTVDSLKDRISWQ